MATSKTPGEFARRFQIIAAAVRRNSELVVKRAAIAADQAAVLATPVDTGRLRANWLVGIGTSLTGTVSFAEGSDGSTRGDVTNAALNRARDIISTYKLGKGAIYITNNVVYAPIIDDGSSAQAPRGMTALAIKAAERQLGSVKLLKGI